MFKKLSLVFLTVLLLSPIAMAGQRNGSLTSSSAAVTSLGATFSSDAVVIGNAKTVSFQMIWASGSSPVGTAKLQGTNSTDVAPATAKWSDLTGLSASVSGNSGDVMFNLDGSSVAPRQLRLVYTRTSGDATVSDLTYQIKE